MSLHHLLDVTITRSGINRRSFLHNVSAGTAAAAGLGALNFRDLMTLQAAELRKQGMSMILLWMSGGPSQMETFDPKPKTENGGPTEAIETAVPGIRIAKGWENVASSMKDIALIRSLTNKEGQHQRATYQLHTGYVPSGSVRYPHFGSAIAKEMKVADHDLPAVVSVGPTENAGFLGVDFEPFVVQSPGQLPRNVALPVGTERLKRRLGLLDRLDDDFAGHGGAAVVANHKQLYGKSSRLVLSPDVKAFDLSKEPESLVKKYGDTQFGKGCLLARRLVESGVTFIEVRSNGWDTHQENFTAVANKAKEVDPAMAALIGDLKQRGMLDKTLVVWMGEFGRTPKINPRTGRDHFPRVFNAAVAGAGIRGGQVIGESSADGMSVKTDPVTVPDLLQSFCKAMQVNSTHENVSPQGRPIKIVDGGKPVAKLFGV